MLDRLIWKSVASLVPAALVGLLASSVVPIHLIQSASADSVDPKIIEEGKNLAFGRKKGNCLACHSIADGTLPGNGGPPLIQMKVRFPEIEKLRDQIWDPTVRNPNSLMPPFGRHGILTEDEIDKVTAYIHTL